MINNMNKKINRLNKKLGVSVQVPEFTSRRMTQSAITNLIVGGTLASAGVLLDKKGLLLLGGLGLFGSILLSFEAEKLK